MNELVNFIVDLVWNMWYTWIFLMMVVESSFIPFPSEAAMIPAWYLISLWDMDFLIVFLCGTLWALTWASINYFLWFYLGWPIIKKLIHKYWKYILLKEEHYIESEKYFKKHGAITTFLGRFIPAVRQLISLPAWIFKMNLVSFLLFTFFWAWVWNLILIAIWYVAGQNQDLLQKYDKESLFLVIFIVVVIWWIYYLINKKKK